MRGPILVMKLGIVKFLREVYHVIERNYRAGETVCGGELSRPGQPRVSGKTWRAFASLLFAPMPLRSSHLPPKMGPLMMDGRVPGWFRRLQFWGADRLVVDRAIGRN